MILGGDIGGTKTNLALYNWTAARVDPVRADSFPSRDYKCLEDMLGEFLTSLTPALLLDRVEIGPIAVACFGIAGPVVGNCSQATNLPWTVDGTAIARRFDIPRVQLLNDLEATAHGIRWLRPDEIDVLNAGAPPCERGALGLIAAGTGLGEAFLRWDGRVYQAMPSEGGHCEFAPNGDDEIELLRYLRRRYGHVSYERIVSGPGLYAVYEFLRDTRNHEPSWLAQAITAGDPSAAIAQAALTGQAVIAAQALDLFVSVYGAEAGNLAMRGVTLDGVYLGGGIAPKLIDKLKDGTFMRAFTNKGRYCRLLSSIPVKVIMNPKTGLLGAASIAAVLAAEESAS